MQEVFLKLLELSLSGSLFAFAVMLVRLVFRKAPRWIFCVLWGVFALRLILPISIESNISLIPAPLANGQLITDVGDRYVSNVDVYYESNAGFLNALEAGRQPIYSNDGYYVVTERGSLEEPATVSNTVFPVLSWLWVTGMAAMLAYLAISFLLLRRRMVEATLLRDNIWQCEQVDSPFVLGFIQPRIYLSYEITDSDMANVIAHEQAHIRRKDHWWKLIGFLLLSIHWFNPVLWLAYIMLCRDIEAACDEKVIKHMEKDEMRAYSTALLNCSVHRRRIAACPLAFGEVGVKERIERVMNYKKPAFWVVLLALVASIVTCILLLTNPAARNTTLMGANYKVTEVLYSTADEDDDRYSRFMITADYVLYAQLEGRDTWNVHEKMEKYPLTAKEMKKYTARKSGWLSGYSIKEITDAYICRVENDYFYLAAQTKNGDTLIGFGWEDVSERGQDGSDDTYLRYLYKVESEFSENEFNVNFFVYSLQDALGVTDCFEAYTNKENPGFMVVGFLSDHNDQAEHGYNDMGFAVFQSRNNGYRLLNYRVYDDAANQNNGIVCCEHPAVMSLNGSMEHDGTFDVVLSCNEKLDKILREYYKDGELTKQIASTHLSGGKSMTLFRWDEMVGSDLRIKQYYFDGEGNEIGSEEYGEAVNYDNLMAMVQNIANNPDCAASSNPFDYIEAKKELYNEIISYGSSAVDFFVSQLRTGENGLQGYIMAVACADITGIGDKDEGADWATAQEWLALYENGTADMVASSGYRSVPMVAFPKGAAFKDHLDAIHWLTIDPYGEDLVPFHTAKDGVVIYGIYTAYDAETFEALKHFVPSGLFPQTYLFQNADPKREYIVLADFGQDEHYAFGVRFGDENSALDALKKAFPEYFGLDDSNGLDVYVWQMARDNYYFGLLPHSKTQRNWISSELINLKGVRAGEMRMILNTYGLAQEDIHVIPWQNPISSYIGDYWIISEGEDMEQKQSNYVQKLRDMLFTQE